MGLAYPMVPISNPHLEFVDQALLSVIPYLAALLSTTPFISTQMVGALIFLGSRQGMRKMKGGMYEQFRQLAQVYRGDVQDYFGLR